VGIKDKMKNLLDLRDQLAAKIAETERGLDALKNKLLGIDAAISTLRGSALGSEPPRPRRNVKRTVMEAVQDAGKAGVTVSDVIERAAAKGRTLERGSVSSLLSRFKREGVLTFDGERYHPVQPVASEPTPTLKIVGK
jgi:hypothetical protein